MVAGSIGRWGCAAFALVATALAGVRPVRAQDQFVVLEQTYTATFANTSDSHYRVPPDAGTPSNWRSPIGDFRLVVDKGKPGNLVSFCEDGVRKISPTQFEVRRKNWRPTRDLHVLIIEPRR